MKMNAVGWFEIYVSDLERAWGFYESLLNVELSHFPTGRDDMDMVIFPHDMNIYGAAGALVRHDMRTAHSQGTLVYFSVPDCEDRARWAVAQGCDILVPKLSIGENGFIAIISDTEGNSIGLHSGL